MTDLERAVASALRLSDKAAESLLDSIQRNIETAQAELIRSGIPQEMVTGNDSRLIEDAIITFCLIRMGDESNRERYENAFLFQQDNLRKSVRYDHEE